MCLLNTSSGPDSPFGNFALVQPLWRRRTCSERQRKYGIQPMSPSVSENRRSGESAQKVAQISSTSVKPDIIDDRLIPTLGGASADTIGALDDEPMWQHRTV